MKRTVTYRMAWAVFFGWLLAASLPAAQAQLAAPAWDWAARGTSRGNTWAYSSAGRVQADAAGNSYVAGTFTDTLLLAGHSLVSPPHGASYVAKHAPDGSVRWLQTFGGPRTELTQLALQANGAGSVYVLGKFVNVMNIGSLVLTDTLGARTGVFYSRAFLAKLDATGQPLWAIQLGSPVGPTMGLLTCTDLKVDPMDHVVIGGNYQGAVELAGQLLPPAPAGQLNFLVASLSSAETNLPVVRWARTAGGPGIYPDVVVAPGPAGEVYASVGVYATTTFDGVPLPVLPAQQGAAVVKYDASGLVQWAQLLPSVFARRPMSNSVQPNALVVNAAGVYVLTNEHDLFSSPSHQAQLAQFSVQGAMGWQQLCVAGASIPTCLDAATDASNNLYVAANIQGTCTFGPLTLQSFLSTELNAAVFSFTAQGAPRRAAVLHNGQGRVFITGLAVTAPDELCVAGSAHGTVQLPPFTSAATSTTPDCLAGHVRFSVVTGTRTGAAPALQLAPNPAHNFATLTLPAAPAARAFALLDALGRPVRHYTVPAGATTARLDVAGLPAGLYVLRGAGATRKLVLE